MDPLKTKPITQITYNLQKKDDLEDFKAYFSVLLRFFSHDLWKLCTQGTSAGPVTQAIAEALQDEVFDNFMRIQRLYELGDFSTGVPYNQYRAERIRGPEQDTTRLTVETLPKVAESMKPYLDRTIRVLPRIYTPPGNIPLPGWYCTNNNYALEPRVQHSEFDTGTALTIDALAQCAVLATHKLSMRNRSDLAVALAAQDSDGGSQEDSSRLDHAFYLVEKEGEITDLSRMLVFVEDKTHFYGLLDECIPDGWYDLALRTVNDAAEIPVESPLRDALPQIMKYYDETKCPRSMLSAGNKSTTMRWLGTGSDEDPYECVFDNIQDTNPQELLLQLLLEAIQDG
ncbi:hypothetical protein EXIGLDRAFT_778410 [Exidia glandulosa HHB12029]|uniref:Uncharacterized protein n=1 Tax=Exidia glandulosa HHB12029 TaxID=1314781 RepID=A0A165CJE6_EXIGL|nr:hypothetical protein EXIGLDRAFT_778410 [Exidia glandulosa HHB12029]